MCKESVGYVAQMKAEADGTTSAEKMVKAISSANRSNVGVTMLFMFFLGLLLVLGVVFTIKGVQGLMVKS